MHMNCNHLLNPLWPKAFWDISGAFANDRELLLLHDFFYRVYNTKLFSLVHGSPLFTWNSGRVLLKLQRTPQEIELCFEAYAKRLIAIDLTFSNLYLTEQHLDSEMGNDLLRMASRLNPTGLNAVISSSDALFDYVKLHYPDIRNVSSILKVTNERGKGDPGYYRDLAGRFDKVMIHPDDAWNFKLLEKLEQPGQYEIIVNENCIRQCPIRHKHYESLSLTGLDYLGHTDRFEELRMKNGCTNLAAMLSDGDICTSQLASGELKTLYDMGFRNFKVQGRGMANSGSQVLDLLRLMLRSDSDQETAMTDIKTRFLEYLSISAPIA